MRRSSNLCVIRFVLLVLTMVAWPHYVSAVPLTWLWASPQPNGNNLVDVVHTNGFYVVLGGRGQLSSSMELRLWTPHASGTSLSLRSAAFFEDYLIITAEQGCILRAAASTNGLDGFEVIDLGTASWIEGVASSGAQLVAVGDNAAIYTSTNGVNWTRQIPAFSDWLRSVAWANNLFVAVGEAGFIATSANGRNWTPRSSGTSSSLNRVAWVGDRFWAVGDSGVVLTSQSGNSWSKSKTGATNDLYAVCGIDSVCLIAGDHELRIGKKTSPQSSVYSWSNELAKTNAPPGWLYYAAVFDGARFLVAGQTGMIVQGDLTPSGLSWSVLTEGINSWLWDAVNIESMLVSVGDKGTIVSSRDGANWYLESTPAQLTNTVFLGIAGNRDMLAAVGSRGGIAISPSTYTNSISTNGAGGSELQTVSSLGIVWHAASSPTSNDLQGVCVAKDRWIASGGAGTILGSPDGLNWTPLGSPTSAFLSSVAAWPGGWVIVGDLGTILTSVDGLSWLPVGSGTTNWLYRVRYLQDRLFAVGENGTVLVSTNGVIWDRMQSPTVRWLNDVAWFGGRFYAAGSRGTLISSENARDWSVEELPTTKSLYALAPHGWQMVAVGIEGVVLRSQTASIQLLSYSFTQDTNTLLFSGQPGQWFAAGQSTDLRSWTTGDSVQFQDTTGLFITSEPKSPGRETQFFKPMW